MSGECYPAKKFVMEPRGSKGMVQGAKSAGKVDHLLEYEGMVMSAESKCSQLKGQLERMKQLYANNVGNGFAHQASLDGKSSKFQSSSKIEARNIDSSKKVSEPTLKSSERKFTIMRQNSRAISTDNTGAALGTVNNILAGIPECIRDPDFFIKLKPADLTSQTGEAIQGVESVKIKSKSFNEAAPSKPTKPTKKVSSKIAAKVSTHTLRKNKKSILKFNETKKLKLSQKSLDNKKPKNSDKSLNVVSVSDKRSRKAVKRLRAPSSKLSHRSKNLKKVSNQDLVEIYHNVAVKESNSSDSNKIKQESSGLVPPLNIDNNQENCDNKMTLTNYSRNYETPTVASRMKQVAKYYMNSFNLKSIPFCTATSTGPSHNIGINIQQVMNMVKTKQADQKLSPTLAYNIGLAAGKWTNKPLSVLISGMTSRTYSQCPLSRSVFNYQQMQEAAKNMPQETIQETDENDINSPETRSLYVTGPSGDVKVNNRKQQVWTMESDDDKKCTCVPHKGVEFQQVIDKYGGNSTSQVHRSTPVQGKLQGSLESATGCTPLEGKEKKLKDVMSKLHDEFETMNKRYEDLSKIVATGKNDGVAAKELERLDKDLNNKQEEIVMVMTLYKEVLALKQQVKNLKERTSKEAVSVKSQVSRFNGYNVTTTAGVLNKLLRQVQHFQAHYKRP